MSSGLTAESCDVVLSAVLKTSEKYAKVERDISQFAVTVLASVKYIQLLLLG